MRRPVVFPAMAFALGITGQYFIKIPMALLVVGGIPLLFLCYRLLYENTCKLYKHVIFFVAIGLFGALWFSGFDLKDSQLSDYHGKNVSGTGIVKDISVKKLNTGGESYKITIEAYELSGMKIREKTLITSYGDLGNTYSKEEIIGRTIHFKGIVLLPGQRRNPNTFDYRNYLKTLGIFTIISCEARHVKFEPDIHGYMNQCLNQLSVIKGSIDDTLSKINGEKTSSVIAGMMWGEKENISDEIMDQFRMNGTAHILAVSGIHVGLIYMYLNMFFLGRKSKLVDGIIILMLICYSAMAAFSPSVIRAVTMIVIHILSKHAFRRYDILSCGALTMILMLLYNPFSLFNVGFQLSFLAIFSLGVVLPFLQRYHNSFVTPIIGLQLGLSPMTGYVFNYFSYGSLIANIPVIFIASLIIPLGLLMIPLTIFRFPMAIISVTGRVMGYLVDGMLMINAAVYSPEKSFEYVTSPSIYIMILYYFTLFFCCSELFGILFLRKKYGMIRNAFFCVIILAFLVNMMAVDEFQKAEMVFVDVGQGDCLHVKTEAGENFLIDSGGSQDYDIGANVLIPYLLKSGVKIIDGAFITHLHQDHYGGIVSLAKKGLVREIFVYEGYEVEQEEILKETGLRKEQVHYLVKGDRINLDEGIYIEVLSPERKSKKEYIELVENKTDENEKSLIMKVVYDGISCMMTGDIDFDGEASVIRQYEDGNMLKSDILKVSHHGSKYGTIEEFLKMVNPRMAVIQVGKNNFGHPNQQVIDRIQEKNIKLFRNDQNGAIGISMDEVERIKIITMYD